MAATRIALVTGGGSGLGRVSALALQAAGFDVVVAGRREAELAATVAGAKAGGGKLSAVVCDVTDEASVVALFAEVEQRHGRLDVLFNNAGTFPPPVAIEDLSLADWNAAVAVNLTGMFLCARQAVRLMKRQTPKGGRIINNGSISAQVPRPRSVAYTATKHAITGLTRQIALDGREHDIACSQIDIGNAATDMTSVMATGMLQADGSRKAEPRMDAAHVADAIVLMARLPLEANIPTMTLLATKMPFGGRG